MAGVPAGVGAGSGFFLDPFPVGFVGFAPDDVALLVGGGHGRAEGVGVVVGDAFGGVGGCTVQAEHDPNDEKSGSQ